MTVPMSWLVVTFVILQFSFGLGRNIESPEDIQHNEFDEAEIPNNSKERYDVVWTLDPFIWTWEPRKWTLNPLTWKPRQWTWNPPTWNPPVWTQNPNDIDFIVNPDAKNFGDMSTDFETRSQEMQNTAKIAFGCFFGFAFVCLVIFLSIRFCCPEKCMTYGRIVIVERQAEVYPPQPIRTDHYPPPPPPAYSDNMQQFPPQYHPPPPGQQTQYPAAQNPGFQYSPVQNQASSTSPHGAVSVAKY